MSAPFRFDLYRHLKTSTPAILKEAEAIGADLGIPSELKGKIGASGASSSSPPALRREIIEAIAEGSRSTTPLVEVGDQIRRVVKSVYGDGYDAAPVSSCEAAVWVTYEALMTPPASGRGDPYRVRCIGLNERHTEHHLSYGRPIPPSFKDAFADRGATAGELGILGRRLENFDMVIVPIAGARYEVHGIKQYACPLLAEAEPEKTAASVEAAAATAARAGVLGGIVSLAYDTIGYGYGTHDADGTPALQRLLGEAARRMNVPYVADNAWGMPFLGTDLRRTGADVTMYSIDKVAGGPTCGLIVGREEPLVNIRRALGIHGERHGTVSAHGKASHVAFDPGKEAMHGLLAALRMIRDRPDTVSKPIEDLHAVVLDEQRRYSNALGEGILVTKSVNLGGVEINYQRTWNGGREDALGIPIFSHEDRLAGSNVLAAAVARMGVVPNIMDDGNIPITPGFGTSTPDGRLIEDRARWVARSIFASLVLVKEWAERAPRMI